MSHFKYSRKSFSHNDQRNFKQIRAVLGQRDAQLHALEPEYREAGAVYQVAQIGSATIWPLPVRHAGLRRPIIQVQGLYGCAPLKTDTGRARGGRKETRG